MSDVPQTELIAFLDVISVGDPPAIRGGCLITDTETKPYEFRCTGPVRPTKLQQILYGSTLDNYVFVDMLGAPLLKAASEQPALVIVRNRMLLNVRPTVAFPIVLVQKRSISSDDDGQDKPLLYTHSEFGAELASAEALLSPLMARYDLLEPFDRLKLALEEAHRQGIGQPLAE